LTPWETPEWRERSREILVDIPIWWEDATRPTNEYDALMRTAPNHEAVASIEERMVARDQIGKSSDCLSDEELWVFNALVVEGLSLRSVARQISAPKTTIARIRDRAARKLREALQDQEPVQAVLKEMGFYDR
jgi:DNA-directed RNA polymerase specialized sigma24 family protein